MYYLNDNHPEYEYAIYCITNNGTPYIAGHFTNKEQIQEHIGSITRRHDKYHQSYYVDNDFFTNEYEMSQSKNYYKVLQRAVNDWQELT